MARQFNPFVYGNPVPHTHFIGRESVINNCYNRLAGPVRTSIAISGEHGIGKTSLLNNLIHLAQEEGWGHPYTRNLFIRLDCQEIPQFTPTRFWHHTLKILKQTEDNLGLHKEIEILLAQPELDATHLQPLLRWLGQHGLSLTLLLDSFASVVKTHKTAPAMISDFLSGLRALTSLPDNALTLLTATRERLNILCADIVKDYPGSYFYNNFAFETLAPFTPTEIGDLLSQALNETGVEFDLSDRDLLNRLAGTHPALFQMAAYYLFEVRRQGPLTDQAYKQVIEDFERVARNYFSLFWEEASPLERTLFILVTLNYLPAQSGLQPDMKNEEIQYLLQRHERDLMRLAERGLIQFKDGGYQIFSAVFVWWIVREVDNEDEIKLADRHKTITDELLRRAWQTLKKLAPHLTLDRITQTLIMRSSTSTPPLSISQTSTKPTQKKAEKKPQPPDTSADIPSRYELQEKLGVGSSGVVYKAFDTYLARTVAIKLLHGELTASLPDLRHQLLHEAQAASQLQHPHIVTIYDVTELNGQICLVMEYLEGQTLAALLQEELRLPLKQVIALIEQAASALDFAHTQKVIHRDIKPANLIITAVGVKITDFSIAKKMDDPQSLHSTGLKGTVIYMSPEQVNQQRLDGRSDLFSLATVAFEMLAGALPWPGAGYFDLMKNIANDPPLSLADFDVPAAYTLEPIFQKALAKDPEDRYQQGQDFAEALKTAA